MVMIVSSTVLLPCLRNNGTKKQFPIDILNLTNQNSLNIYIFFSPWISTSWVILWFQGRALRKISTSQEFQNYEILGTQHINKMSYIKLFTEILLSIFNNIYQNGLPWIFTEPKKVTEGSRDLWERNQELGYHKIWNPRACYNTDTLICNWPC